MQASLNAQNHFSQVWAYFGVLIFYKNFDLFIRYKTDFLKHKNSFSFSSHLVIFKKYVCVCVCAEEARRGIGSLGAGVTGLKEAAGQLMLGTEPRPLEEYLGC